MTLPITAELKRLRDTGLPADTYARVNNNLFHLSERLLDEVIRLQDALGDLHAEAYANEHRHTYQAERTNGCDADVHTARAEVHAQYNQKLKNILNGGTQ